MSERGREVLFEKVHKGCSLGTENILHLDLDSVYTIVFICKNLSSYILKICVLYCMLYPHKIVLKRFMYMYIFLEENPEVFFFFFFSFSNGSNKDNESQRYSNFQPSACLEKLPSLYIARGSQLSTIADFKSFHFLMLSNLNVVGITMIEFQI